MEGKMGRANSSMAYRHGEAVAALQSARRSAERIIGFLDGGFKRKAAVNEAWSIIEAAKSALPDGAAGENR